MKLQKIAANFNKILFRYEVFGAHGKLQHFLRNYNFIFESPVEILKFQININFSVTGHISLAVTLRQFINNKQEQGS